MIAEWCRWRYRNVDRIFIIPYDVFTGQLQWHTPYSIEREFFRKGKNEIEAKRNIPKWLVDAFKKKQKNPKASTKKMGATSPKRVSKVVNLASKGKGRKLM